MDIKPVKKRRQRPVVKPSHVLKNGLVSNRKSIDLKSKVNLSDGLRSQPSIKRNRLLAFIKSNLLLIIFSIFLIILYLPTSKLLIADVIYKDLVGQSLSVEAILNHSSFLPQKFILQMIEYSGLNGSLLAKFLNFILIILTVYLFYVICLKWLGRNTALLTTLLFSTSSWMILSSQNLSFNNIYLIFVPLAIYTSYLLSGKNNALTVFAAAMMLSIVLYSPGMVWPVLGIIILLPVFMQTILAKYNLNNIWVLLVSIFILILPLFASFAVNTGNFSTILTGDGSITIQALSHNIQDSLNAMFISGLPQANLWLVGSPVFNYLICLFALFGLAYLLTEKKLRDQFDFLIVCLIFSLVAIVFVGLPALSLLVPTFYIISGFGIKLLLNSWYRIFPSNPVARNLGLSLIIFVVLLSAAYEITRYHVAWPKADDLANVLSSEKAA